MSEEDQMREESDEEVEKEEEETLAVDIARGEEMAISEENIIAKRDSAAEYANSVGISVGTHFKYGGEDFVQLYSSPGPDLERIREREYKPILRTYNEKEVRSSVDFQSSVSIAKRHYESLISGYNRLGGVRDKSELQSFVTAVQSAIGTIMMPVWYHYTGVGVGGGTSLWQKAVNDIYDNRNIRQSVQEDAFIRLQTFQTARYAARYPDHNNGRGMFTDAWWQATANLFRHLEILGMQSQGLLKLEVTETDIQSKNKLGVGNIDIEDPDWEGRTELSARLWSKTVVTTNYFINTLNPARAMRYVFFKQPDLNREIAAHQLLSRIATIGPEIIQITYSILFNAFSNAAAGRMLLYEPLSLWFNDVWRWKTTEKTNPNLSQMKDRALKLVQMIGMQSFGLGETNAYEVFPEFKDELASYDIAYRMWRFFKSTEGLKKSTIRELSKKFDTFVSEINMHENARPNTIERICNTNQISKSGCEIYYKEKPGL